ncbi:fluoride efflux transporter FluC [Bacillus suaedaesalsae]|uniref:Fluoride-specific ion channel FluC n=1 Tax=Bacillus suaedaesalsae TaxID=2810349 RepID=A0ABS2DGT7_9BACI|nr:CrcB family protein [Bacillus suaedaesalsae]MBM6617637.1 CrcB family protein [Bacillus suaedaesalsae]
MTFLYVCIGGVLGALGRYTIGVMITKYLPQIHAYVSTIIVNGIGSFVLGIVLSSYNFSSKSSIMIGITIGLIGSFTTYSTFALDCVKFIHRKEWMACMYYVVGTLLISIGLFSIGYYIL